MAGTFLALLGEWVGADVTVVNPESYKSTALGKGLTFQTYQAKLEEMGDDFIRLSFAARKADAESGVEQLIPTDRIKRLSLWGGEKLIHL
jgi:hypothetical protein